MHTIREFGNLNDAIDYRKANGTGGYIYHVNDNGTAILFPPDFTPSMIFEHPMARLSGRFY